MIKHLIVEAESDKLFIQTFFFFFHLNLQLHIDLATPQDLERAIKPIRILSIPTTK